MKYPSFNFEKKLWQKGFSIVAGVDEVGRGCFAGPVVAGAVAFSAKTNFQMPIFGKEGKEVFINDSKKLTPKRRMVANDWIKENALSWGIGEASVTEINRLGMAKATNSAFRRAISKANRKLHKKLEYLLIDAFFVPYVSGLPSVRRVRKNGRVKKYNHKNTRQMAIVNGDSRSISIAAASIVAKVYRDSLMEKIGSRKNYLKYGWVSNKGYGSKVHRDAIIKYGICCHHRKQFVETFLSKLEV
jgi:ribonuclease HII